MLNAIEQSGRASEAQVASQNLKENRFRVVVIGEMKRGKSTLINAMLGEELLPANPGLACTAIPIRVTSGTARRALCYKRSGESPLECTLPQESMWFWEAVTIPPKELRIGPDDEAWAIRNHPYERAEITAPIGLLECGVELEDSPGLNEDSRRSATTWNQVAHSDAVVLVLDGFKVVSESDREDLQRLWDVGRDPRGVFVVWNQMDRYGDNLVALDQARQVATEIIEATGISRDHIFFVSGQAALQGRLREDRDLVEKSGVPAFENGLGAFLVRERRAIKLLTPLNIARQTVEDALEGLLPRQVQVWSEPIRIANEGMAQAKKLTQTRRRIRATLSADLKRAADDFRGEVAASARAFVQDNLNSIEGAVDSVPLTSWEAVFESKASMQRLMKRAEEWLLERARDWERSQLALLAVSHQTNIRRVSEEAAIELDGVRADAAEIEERLLSASDRVVRDVSAASRTASRQPTQEDLAARISSLGASADSGMSVLAGLGFGAVIGGICAAWLTALFLLPFMLALIPAIVLGGLVAGKSAAGMLKARAGEAIRRAMREGSAGLEARLTARVDEYCVQIDRAITDWLAPNEAEIDRCLAAIEAFSVRAQQDYRDRLASVGELESRLRRMELDIGELARETDPAHDEERLAARIGREIEAKLAALQPARDSQQGTSEHTEAVSAPELKRKLGDTWFRLQAVKGYFEEEGRWRPEMELKLAAMWLWCKDVLSATAAPLQEPAFLTVAAIAVSEGSTQPPHPKEVRKRYHDVKYQIDLVKLHVLITGATDGSYFKDTDNAGTAHDKFCAAYKRAYDKLVPPDPRDGTMRPGTVIDGIRERDPYKAG
ncbi:MAG: dynamin family protein [Phycisphaerales bacterium]